MELNQSAFEAVLVEVLTGRGVEKSDIDRLMASGREVCGGGQKGKCKGRKGKGRQGKGGKAAQRR